MSLFRSNPVFLSAACLVSLVAFAPLATAQDPPPRPEMVDLTLDVRPVVKELVTPIAIAFIPQDSAGMLGGAPTDEMFVLEKNTGRILRVAGGVVIGPVLDLGVNNASERGLLGIALHPGFPGNPSVYLYWSCVAPVPTDPFSPSLAECDEGTMFGPDSANLLATPLLGNRVDRFVWNGASLVFDRNIIRLRSFQNDGGPEPPGQGDAGQPARGNHDGGVLRFGPDGKLYVQVGDLGRRGQLQNLPCGPTAVCPGPVMPDDQFGGPEPDDAHFSGVILRLNDDGTAPTDNPFFAVGQSIGAEVGANIQKVYAYGIRNGFGMAFDPISGELWEQENGDDSFSELNRVIPGLNSGWIQIMGPVSRIGEFKQIETMPEFFGLQQLRWSPVNIANTPQEALQRLFSLPGSQYKAPEFSWRFEVSPGGIGFAVGPGLGPTHANDLFMGAARPSLQGGHLFKFDLTTNREEIAVSDPRLQDRVADNRGKFDLTESESLLVGRNFGVVTDIHTGPNGNLFVVSLDHGAIYEIFRRQQGSVQTR
jgi:aldose sugar dehydrogenase